MYLSTGTNGEHLTCGSITASLIVYNGI